MVTYKHNQLYYELHFSDLDEDTVNVLSFEGEEEISNLFEYRIELVSKDPELDSLKILNKAATFILNRGDEDPIKKHGIISKFEQFGKTSDYIFYKVVLVPQIWRLNLIFQNEVYQNMDIKELIETILKDIGLTGSDYKIDLKGSYPKKEFIVQYRENSFNFLNRRLEHHGIYYYFDHSGDKDMIVFTDSISMLKDLPVSDAVGFNINKDPLMENESIYEITCKEKVVTGMVQLKDCNYMFPEKQLMAQSQLDSSQPGSYYDFGDYFETEKEAEALAKTRNQEFLAAKKIFYGKSDNRYFSAGYKFKMNKHYRESWNSEYIITKVTHRGNQHGLFGLLPAARKVSLTYENNFTCIQSDIEFRPMRKAPKPKISGIMSAKIDASGDGQYASIDDHGRYKVKIPFDLSDKQNGEASQYIRMAQPYAGGGYGIHFPLHKGAEVLLTFMDGDPDRPAIVGAIPNPSNASPVTGGNQTQSVIRTAANNEIVIEDSGGSEQIHINQACGNEILMKAEGPDIEIKQKCGNEILMKAEGPDIEIKQKCGNEILMKETEGIQIRDKYGNEIVLDSGAGTMKMRSPSHESVIELGKSIYRASNSNDHSFISGDKKMHIGGWTHETFVGLKTEASLAAKFSTVNGFEYKRNYAYLRERGYSKQDKIISAELKLDSQSTTKLIGGYGNADLNKIVLTDKGDVDILIESMDANIKFKKGGEMEIHTPKKLTISADGGIEIKSPDNKITLTTNNFEITGKELNIPRAVINGKNIKVED